MSCSNNCNCDTAATTTVDNGDAELTDDTSVQDNVKEYYGKVLQTKGDLKSEACVTQEGATSALVRSVRKLIHQEVQNKYYGCGIVVPENLPGMNVLDLGSGAGLDCFILSKLVGQTGHVTGVDMTDEQIDVARSYVEHHTKLFGYQKPNVDFVQGYIEKLQEAGIQPNFYDIIISNCVINLSPDKPATLREAYNVLKVGGEMYFSDVYADRDLPESVRKHKVLWGECVAGAMWWQDLYKICQDVGFSPPRLVSASKVDALNPELKVVTGDAAFVSATYRLFKVPAERESPGQVIYNGEVDGCEEQLTLDHTTIFKTEEPVFVGPEVATILKSSRFSEEFTYRLNNKKVCCQQPCQQPCLQTEDHMHDPFKYCDENKQPRSLSSTCCKTSGCC